jgi:endonuclease III
VVISSRILASFRRKAAAVDAALQRAYGAPALRPPRDPLGTLVHTILSQHTSDVNSARGFARLRQRFAGWTAVRDAPDAAVIEAVRPSGLGVIKAARIQAVLRRITAERGILSLRFLRAWPAVRAKAWLRTLPGVGPKTAAIVLVFGLGKPAFPVDTHVERVGRRLGLILRRMDVERAHDWMEAIIRPARYGRFHLLLVRHGRETCKAVQPRCGVCSVRRFCDYYRSATRRR